MSVGTIILPIGHSAKAGELEVRPRKGQPDDGDREQDRPEQMAELIPTEPDAAIAWLKTFKNKPKPQQQGTAKAEKLTPVIAGYLDQLAIPRIDEAEAARKLEAAGLKIIIEGHETYVIQGPRGNMWFEGSSPSDETFTNDPLGALNISKAWRFIAKYKPPQIYRIPIDDGLFWQLSTGDLEVGTLKAMTPERRELPILFVIGSRGAFLIDGGHRVLARAMAKVGWVYAVIISEEVLPQIKVRIWKSAKGGQKIEVDTTKGYLAIFN